MAGRKLSSNGLPLDHYSNCALKEPSQSFKVSLVTKITQFIEVQQLHFTFNELIWQKGIESQPSRIRISHCSSDKRPALFASHGKPAEANLPFASLVFSTTKCFISFQQRLDMSKGNSTFYESKRSKRPSMSYPGAKHTRFKPK